MPTVRDTAIRLLEKIFRTELVPTDEGGYKACFRDGETEVYLRPDRITEALKGVTNYKKIDETSVSLDGVFEVLLRRSSGLSGRIPIRPDGELRVSDKQGGKSYIIGPASGSYALFILLNSPSEADFRRLHRGMPIGYLLDRQKRISGEADMDLLDLLVRYLGLRTLRIESNTPVSSDRWQRLADSFFFQLGYNLDVAITQERYLDELVRPARISHLRRSALDDLDVPRREYIADLLYHYQLGVSAESPMLEFLSYYHVAEHWFESIYHEDLVAKLQTQITSPGFSYRRTNDIKKVIKTVTQAVQLRDDDYIINEQSALKLTLERHVDLGELTADLDKFEAGLVDFFMKSKVEFCSGSIVNLRDTNTSSVYTALANRIYKTRNALVHSKDGAKARFIPFSHDKQLIQEVTLVRLIAEQIIVSTSVILS